MVARSRGPNHSSKVAPQQRRDKAGQPLNTQQNQAEIAVAPSPASRERMDVSRGEDAGSRGLSSSSESYTTRPANRNGITTERKVREMEGKSSHQLPSRKEGTGSKQTRNPQHPSRANPEQNRDKSTTAGRLLFGLNWNKDRTLNQLGNSRQDRMRLLQERFVRTEKATAQSFLQLAPKECWKQGEGSTTGEGRFFPELNCREEKKEERPGSS